jgi:hypothetical protein
MSFSSNKPLGMALKRSHGGSSRGERELNRVEEWMESVSTEAALNRLVVNGVLPDREIAGWCPTAGEGFSTLVVMNLLCSWGISIMDLDPRFIPS